MLNLLEEQFFRSDELTFPEKTRKFLNLKLAKNEHEVFSVVYLDTQHQLIGYEEIFRRTIDGAAVYPREVVKCCLHNNAAAVIFLMPIYLVFQSLPNLTLLLLSA